MLRTLSYLFRIGLSGDFAPLSDDAIVMVIVRWFSVVELECSTS